MSVINNSLKNYKQEIISIKNKSENKYCADCLATETAWASTNLGVFVCINCSGVHRSMGTHISKVKSVELDEWNDEEQYEVMNRVGNVEANAFWECNLFPFEKPSAHDKYSYRKKFITDKYVKKQYLPTPDNFDYKLEREFDIALTSKKGNVIKQGAKRKNWKKRWFVLHDDTLSYYKSQNDSYPAGSVKIEVDSLVMFVDEFQIGKKNCFAIVTKNRNYYMVCDVEEEVCEWIYALRASVYYANLKKVYNDPRNFLRGDQAKRVEKKGILKKQGGSFKSIRTRFFVLKDSALSYYKSEKEMEPIDSIDLKGTRVEATKNTKCGITLHTVGRQYFFLAESERDREEWIDAINNVTKVLNEGELIQKKSIAIHQLILNRIKEAKKEKANDILSEQVSPHSPMMWKSLSFHRCRNQFLDKTENSEKVNATEIIINPVERLKKLYQEGKLSKLSGIVSEDSADSSSRVSLMFPEGMKVLTNQANTSDTDLTSQNMRVSLFAASSPMLMATSPSSSFSNQSPAVSTPNSATIINVSTSFNSSGSGSGSSFNDVKISDIKLQDKEKKNKKNKKDKLMIEHEVNNDGDHAMEIMIKDSFSVTRNTNQVRESDDLDDLDDLINHAESIKLKYETESDSEESSLSDSGEFTSVSLNGKSPAASSSRRIIESDSDNSDEEISLNTTTVKPPSSNSGKIVSNSSGGKIVLKANDSSSSEEEESDEDQQVEATFSVKPTVSQQHSISLNSTPSVLSTPSTRIKTRTSTDKSKRKKKKNQSTFRRMHGLVEDQLESMGIDVE